MNVRFGSTFEGLIELSRLPFNCLAELLFVLGSNFSVFSSYLLIKFNFGASSFFFSLGSAFVFSALSL